MNTKFPLELRRTLVALSVTLATASTRAQDDAPVLDDDNVIELSPFEVDSSADRGYRAENTLSGSRLNTSLRDTAASVSVFTEEFALDVAANDLEELVLYDANVQVESFESQGAVNSGTFNTNLPSQRNGFRSRGIEAGASRDFYPWYSPQDNYNIGRSDFSKGPNGVLFGIGGIGGVVNASTQRALLRRNATNISLQAGSWELFRATVDHNQVFVRDILALRLMYVDQSNNGYRFHDFKEKRRGTAALTFKPFRDTTLRMSYEKGHELRSNQRPFGVQDNILEWYDAGQPLAELAGNGRPTASNQEGVGVRNNNRAAIYFVNEPGMLTGAINGARGATTTTYNDTFSGSPATDPDFRRRTQGQRFYDEPERFGALSTSNRIGAGGPDAIADNKFNSLMVQLEQKLTDDLILELSYFRDKIYSYGQNPGGVSIEGDPNATISNGGTGNGAYLESKGAVANPFAGQYYMENVWRTAYNDNKQDAVRVTLAYELDLGKNKPGLLGNLMGRHRFAAMAEQRQEDLKRDGTYEVLNDAGRALVPGSNNDAAENVANRISRRNYVAFGDWENFHTGRFPTDRSLYFPQFDETVESVFVPTNENAIGEDLTTNDISMLALQSYFWDGRFVTTLGYRRDHVVISESGAVRDADDSNGNGVSNEWIVNADDRLLTDQTGKSKTFGAVFHALPSISLTYNYASAIDLAGTNNKVAPDGLVAPPRTGETNDYGVAFSLLDNKLSGRVTYFETVQKERFFFQTAGMPGTATRVLDLLQSLEDGAGNPLVSQAEYDAHNPSFNGSRGDLDSSGFEIRLVGNPTDNITLVFTYTKTDRVLSNVLLDLEDYANSELAFYNEKLGLIGASATDSFAADGTTDIRVTKNGDRETVASDMGDVFDEILSQRFNREFGFGEKPDKLVTTANYEFRDGSLRGLKLGGTFRWYGGTLLEPVLVFDDLNGNFSIDSDEILGGVTQDGEMRGPSQSYTDIFASYRVRRLFGYKVNLQLQLNVYNVFNNDDIDPQRLVDGFDGIAQYRYVEPRSFRFTMRYSF